MRKRLAIALARPLIAAEVPGWGRIYDRVVGGHERNADWADSEPRVIRDKRSGLLRVLDLREWADRQFFFLKRWYDLPALLLVERLLRPGGRVVDVGANYGHFSLACAARVGPEGHVDAVEPNPASFARLGVHVHMNGLENMTIHALGLSDSEGTLELSIPGINSGEASFATRNYRDATTVTCPVTTLDSLGVSGPIDLIKIDVEGFESRVIRGGRDLIDRDRPAILTEVDPGHLAAAGSSPADLAAELSNLGYTAYAVGLRKRRAGHRLALARGLPSGGSGDVLWLPAGDSDAAAERLVDAAPGPA